MTTSDLLTDLWDWQSPAWWIAIAATIAYVIVARRRNATSRQVSLFIAAAALFILALASPIGTLAAHYLFSAHMLQHLLLLLIVPLLAMLAWPPRKAGSISNSPSRGLVPLGWAAGVAAMWFWHIPALCTASLQSPAVFDIQTVSLLAAGAAFWRPVFSPVHSQRISPNAAAGYLFSGCVGCSLLGIYVTFSPTPVCPMYRALSGSAAVLDLIRNDWGLSCRVDQQIGGLLMWVPACLVYLGAILASLGTWYAVPVRVPPAASSNDLITE